MTERRFLPREDRKRLHLLTQSWRSRGEVTSVNNAIAAERAIQAADQAEFMAERIDRAELVMADLHRELIRGARKGKLQRRDLLRFADQLDEAHDLLRGQ